MLNDGLLFEPDSLRESVGGEMHRLGLIPSESTRIGVALSGGADSVALTVALCRLGFAVTVLHCNFHLRGDESDGDESYCRLLAANLDIPILVNDVDAKSMKRGGESIEMVCRRARYEWFERVATELRLDAIAIAHHREDQIETALINLFRGTGVAGLRGMLTKRGLFVRPMLSLRRDAIEAYLKVNGITFRVDSSNWTNDYRRNVIRNEILPLIDQYFPDATEGILKTAENARDIEKSLDFAARKIIGDGAMVDSLVIAEFGDNVELLVRASRMLLPPGISYDVAAQVIKHDSRHPAIFQAVDGTPIQFYKGRLSIVAPDPSDEQIEIKLDLPAKSHGLEIAIITRDEFLIEKHNATSAYLDASILDCHKTLTFRHPRTGDRLSPYGMSGSRLVSDILKEAGLSPSQRAASWVAVAGDRILWVVGIRASRHYAVTKNTDKVIRLRATAEFK